MVKDPNLQDLHSLKTDKIEQPELLSIKGRACCVKVTPGLRLDQRLELFISERGISILDKRFTDLHVVLEATTLGISHLPPTSRGA